MDYRNQSLRRYLIMFYEAAQTYTRPLSPFAPYAPITDRASWEQTDANWRRETILLGEQYLHYTYPYISATDFMDFLRTGNRVRFEDKCFAKRRGLSALVLAECVEHKGRFMDDIINGIFSICEESAWQLPPHNSYQRDTPQLLLPDATQPVLDLFACETGAILGTVCYLLKEKLDAISPFLTRRIAYELDHRIFTPYLTRHFWWMGNGSEPMNNWTIWCTQNVLLSAFLTECDSSLKHQIFMKACRSVDYFLAEYGEDGCCDEGAQYYRHAGLCLFNTMELLNAVTVGHFAAFYHTPKIRNIASYILNAHIDDKYYLNFADCSPVAGRAGCREFLFALRTDNEAMASFAAHDFEAGGLETLLLPQENNLYYRLQNGFTVAAMRAYFAAHPEAVSHPDLYYPSVGVFIARDSVYYLAVKAGDNADSHNHNDVGSFTVYKNGLPLLIDVGVESYTKKTFSPERYEIWTMQSDYHNLPTIKGQMQKDGEAYRAKDVHYEIGKERCSIRMDIADAYPEACGLSSYLREAVLWKNKEILIRDTFSFTSCPDETPEGPAVLLNLMTCAKPVLCDTLSDICFRIGDLGILSLKGGRLFALEEIPVTDARLQTAWPHALYRLRIAVTGQEIELRLAD
jgi:hypothetical protein